MLEAKGYKGLKRGKIHRKCQSTLKSLQKLLPFKQRVQGSSPCAPTNLFKGLGGFLEGYFLAQAPRKSFAISKLFVSFGSGIVPSSLY